MQLLYTPNEFGLGLSPDEIVAVEGGEHLILELPVSTGETIFRIGVRSHTESLIYAVPSTKSVMIFLDLKDLDYLAQALGPVVRKQGGVEYSIYNIGTFGEDIVDVEAVEVVDPVEDEVPDYRSFADREALATV